MQLEKVTPEPADRIVFEKPDGLFDVQDGTRKIHREGLPQKVAHEIAVVGANEYGGRVLFAHHSDPDAVVQYNFPK